LTSLILFMLLWVETVPLLAGMTLVCSWLVSENRNSCQHSPVDSTHSVPWGYRFQMRKWITSSQNTQSAPGGHNTGSLSQNVHLWRCLPGRNGRSHFLLANLQMSLELQTDGTILMGESDLALVGFRQIPSWVYLDIEVRNDTSIYTPLLT
jgi:hypothetical protein